MDHSQMGKPIPLAQFAIAIVLFVVVLYVLPERYRYWIAGIVILGALLANPRTSASLARYIQGGVNSLMRIGE